MKESSNTPKMLFMFSKKFLQNTMYDFNAEFNQKYATFITKCTVAADLHICTVLEHFEFF